jgi:hypothetical protein
MFLLLAESGRAATDIGVRPSGEPRSAWGGNPGVAEVPSAGIACFLLGGAFSMIADIPRRQREEGG